MRKFVFILGQYDKVYLFNLELPISGHVATLTAAYWSITGLRRPSILTAGRGSSGTRLVGEGRGLATIVLSSLG